MSVIRLPDDPIGDVRRKGRLERADVLETEGVVEAFEQALAST